MTTSSATRSIDIDAAAEEVFVVMSPGESLKADPELLAPAISGMAQTPMNAEALGRRWGYSMSSQGGQLSMAASASASFAASVAAAGTVVWWRSPSSAS